jgi:pyruvate dehydrogenase E1 component alpha subunit
MKTPRKKPADAPPGEGGFSLISNDKLLALYAAMLRCRMLADRLGRAGGGERARGGGDREREAVFVGAMTDLDAKDAISHLEGSVIPCFLKGVPLKTMLAGRRQHGARLAAHGVIRPAASLESQLESALRAAHLNRRRRNKKVVVLFAGDAQAWGSAALESLRVAAASKLPILFLCDGVDETDDLEARAHDSGVPGMIVDGHDVVAVYRVVSEAMTHARRGNGPTLIECRPWIVEEAGREQAGRRRRASGDAIRNMEKYLAGKKLFSRKFKAGIVAEFSAELDEAAAVVKSAERKKAATVRRG